MTSKTSQIETKNEGLDGDCEMQATETLEKTESCYENNKKFCYFTLLVNFEEEQVLHIHADDVQPLC
jgi:hypothetical protein